MLSNSTSAIPPGNCGIHGYHGRTNCPKCSTSTLPFTPLISSPPVSAAVSPVEPPERDYYGPQPANPVWVRFECGHRAFIDRAEYGDGSALCGGCGEIQTYARCLTCGSLDCQSREGPTVAHA